MSDAEKGDYEEQKEQPQPEKVKEKKRSRKASKREKKEKKEDKDAEAEEELLATRKSTDEYDEAPPEKEKSSKEKKSKKAKKEAERDAASDEEDPLREKETSGPAGDVGSARAGGDYPLETPIIARKTHYIMLGFLATTLVCLLAIVPTRSLGLGKFRKSSAGAWSFCYDVAGVGETCQSEMGGIGARGASGVFGILSMLLCVVKLGLCAYDMTHPGGFRLFLKVVCGLHHALWFFLMISWACWASFHNQWNALCDKAPKEQFPDHMLYGWGFLFLIFMWLVHIVLAVIWTLKVMGKSPLGL